MTMPKKADFKLPTTQDLLEAHDTSYWLKSALRTAWNRDPVDAASDAELLASVLTARVNALMAPAQARP